MIKLKLKVQLINKKLYIILIKEFETIEFMIDDIVKSDFLKSYIIAKHKLGLT